MSIPVINFPPFRPYSNITPFTVRDGATYLTVLEELRNWLNTTLVPHVDTEIANLVIAWEDNASTLLANVIAALNEQSDTVTAQLNEQNASILQQLNDQNAAITAQLSAQDADVASQIDAMTTYVDNAVQSIINSTIEVSDPVVLGVLNANGESTQKVRDLSNETVATFTNTVISSGDTTGASDTAALNVAITAAAAAGGGVVRGQAGATFYTNAPVVARSGVTLDMRGTTWHLVAGSNCNIIQSSNLSPVSTAADAAMDAGSAVVTTVMGAYAVVGQTCVVRGALGTAGGPLTAVVASSTATTITLEKLETGQPAVAGVTVSGATVELYTRLQNVDIRLGDVVREQNNGGAWITLLSFNLFHIDGISFTMRRFHSTEYGALFRVGDFTRGYFNLPSIDVAKGGLVAIGPIYGMDIASVQGSTDDDMVALLGQDWETYGLTGGDISGVHIGSIKGVTTAGSLFKVIAGDGCRADGIECSLVQGKPWLNGVWIGDDDASETTKGGTYGAIKVGLVDVRPASSTGAAAVGLKTPDADYIDITVRGSVEGYGPGVAIVPNSPASRPARRIKTLRVAGHFDYSSGVSDRHAVTLADENTKIDKLILDGVTYLHHLTSGNGALVNVGAVTGITEVDAIGVTLESANRGFVIDCGAINNGAYVERVNILGGSYSGLANFHRQVADPGRNIVITLGGGVKFTGLTYGIIADADAVVSNFELVFAGAVIDTVSNNLVRIKNSSVLVRGDGFAFLNFATGVFGRATGGIGVFRSQAQRLPLVLSNGALSRSDRGDVGWDANALTGTVGPVISTGTGSAGSWMNLITGATY